MKRSHRQYLLPILAIVLSVGAAGCTNNDGSGSTTTGPTPNLVTETFTGTVTQGGTDIHPFTVNNTGFTLLAAFTVINPSTVPALGVGIGNWDATNSICGLNQTQNDTSTVGSTAISVTAPSGPFCVRVYAGVNVPAGTTATYTLQLEHY